MKMKTLKLEFSNWDYWESESFLDHSIAQKLTQQDHKLRGEREREGEIAEFQAKSLKQKEGKIESLSNEILMNYSVCTWDM